MVNYDENLHKVILDHSIHSTYIEGRENIKQKYPTATNDKILAAFDRDGFLHDLF